MIDSILYEAVEYLIEGGYTPLITDSKQELLSMIRKTGYDYDVSYWEEESKGNILKNFLEEDSIAIEYKVKFIGIILPKIKARRKKTSSEYEWFDTFYDDLSKWYKKQIDNEVIVSGNNIKNLKLHGEGSYAVVHTYKDENYNKKIVKKKAKNNLSSKEKIRFLNEFKITKQLKSPYIIDVYKLNSEEISYTMEYLDYTLNDYILTNNSKLGIEERKRLCLQLISAFKYIHSKKILHRDISPRNILIKTYEDTVILKVADFGLVKDPRMEMTSIDTKFKGYFNDPYLSEIGFSKYALEHEIYAITKVIIFILTGKENTFEVENENYKRFFDKGMNRDTNLRYKNCDELLEEFKKIFK